MTNVKLNTIDKNQPLPDLKLYFVDFGLTTTENEADNKTTAGT